jgi:adenosine deaminase
LAERQDSLFAPELSDLHARLRPLPKIELHAHLSGCLRFSTVERLALDQDLDIPKAARADLLAAVRFAEPAKSYHASFSPWRRVLNRITEIPHISSRLLEEVAEDMASDGVVYAELRVGPRLSWKPHELQAFLEELTIACSRARSQWRIEVALIVGFTRKQFFELGSDQATALWKLIRACQRYAPSAVVAFDLWGDEHGYPASLFHRSFATVRDEGYSVTVHAGEASGARNVRDAIDLLGASRIGHGLSASADQPLLEEMRARDIAIEVCLTSNWITGVVPDLASHPIQSFVSNGVPVALCTDNTLVLGTTLTAEVTKSLELGLISAVRLGDVMHSAVKHSFASQELKKQLSAVIDAAYTEAELNHLQSTLDGDGLSHTGDLRNQ